MLSNDHSHAHSMFIDVLKRSTFVWILSSGKRVNYVRTFLSYEQRRRSSHFLLGYKSVKCICSVHRSRKRLCRYLLGLSVPSAWLFLSCRPDCINSFCRYLTELMEQRKCGLTCNGYVQNWYLFAYFPTCLWLNWHFWAIQGVPELPEHCSFSYKTKKKQRCLRIPIYHYSHP